MSYVKTKFPHNLLLFIGLFTLFASQPSFATTKKFEILHLFDRISAPPGIGGPNSLIQGKNGNLYGGAFGSYSSDEKAVFFKINLTQPTLPIYSNFLTLGSGDSVYFIRHFIEARNGSFYGVGSGGGGYAGPGFLFKVTRSQPPDYKVLMEVPKSMADGIRTTEFLEGKSERFYSTTSDGGISFDQGSSFGGKILQFIPSNPNPDKQTKTLHYFDYINGFDPTGSLIKGKDSKLYGTTCGSASYKNNMLDYDYYKGVIYSFDLNKTKSAYKVLHRFNTTDGGCPQGLTQGVDGKFYGTTLYGGIANQGVIFSLSFSKAKPVYRVLHHFNNTVSVNAQGKVFQSWNGKLYGATSSGGKLGLGTLFQLDISAKKPIYTVIHAFDGKRTGSHPQLIMGKDENLYGVAQNGPLKGGLVFRVKLPAKSKWY